MEKEKEAKETDDMEIEENGANGIKKKKGNEEFDFAKSVFPLFIFFNFFLLTRMINID